MQTFDHYRLHALNKRREARDLYVGTNIILCCVIAAVTIALAVVMAPVVVGLFG